MASLAAVYILVIFLICSCVAEEYKVFCQYDMDSNYYKNTSTFYNWHIDSRLCTHLVLGSGIGVDRETGALKITNDDLLKADTLSQGKFFRYESIQKVLISVGGYEAESRPFSRMVASSAKRDKFYTSLVDFLVKRGYDGVQIDWRYPTQRGGQPDDKKNFVLFLEELGMIFRDHKFILMVTVLGRTDPQTLQSYDIPRIVKQADFINLMVDDERDKYSLRLGYIAPLLGNANSVAAAVKHWKKVGKAPHKLILQIPFFGRSYTMDKNQSTVGSPCKGPGKQTRNSRRAGFTTYNEFCTQASKWSKQVDKVAKVPYATRGDQWLSFEDSESIWAKMHFLKKEKLGGAMAWTIDADDFFGRCGIRYGLLNVVFAALGDPNALTTQPPTTEAAGLCPRDGFARDLWDCRFYHECRQGERIEYECIEGQYFDEAKEYCRPAAEVKCNDDFITWRPGMPGYSYDNVPLNLKVVE